MVVPDMASAPVPAPRREIDLAASHPAGRLSGFPRLAARSLQIAFWAAIGVASLPWLRVRRGNWRSALGVATLTLFQRLGATFIKIGQIISTRPDIFSPEFIAPLTALQDAVPPFGFDDVRRAIEDDFGRKLEEVFAEFDKNPVASASVAQVHRAVLQPSELPPSLASPVVAVKVRRPGIVRRAALDEALLEFGARILSRVSSFSLLSPREHVREFCEAVNAQLDFRIEADNNRQFRKNFEGDPHVIFPALLEHLCSDRVLTMEFIEGVKDDKIRAVGGDPEFLSRKGTEAIVRMIFQHGFVHADLHPGNILFLGGNRLALIDLGLVGRLDQENRRRFAFLCYYIVAGMGSEVARWLAENSRIQKLRDYGAFEREIIGHIAEFHDRPFEQVQLAGLIAGVYDIARRHSVLTEATFAMANIAIMVIEGIGRKIDPKLNVTRETRPHLESALALAVSGAQETAEVGPTTAPKSFAAGRYRLRRLLGEGVRKRVYLARDTRLDRDVALAILRTEGLDAADRTRIVAEARAVAKLSDHPRIVAVFDTGEEDGIPYIVMQYMAGGTLSNRLLKASEHRMPLGDVLRHADEICQALEHAHRHGIIHRDVKPENVWLSEDGLAKLGDFGLARVIGKGDDGFASLTVGTALYMSPEQALGRTVDARSDLYSLGATLYELLTGRPPFEGDTVAEVIARHLNANPESPSRRNPQIPPSLDALILKLLAKSADNRFESAESVRRALRDLPTPGSASATAPPPESDAAAPSQTMFVGRDQEMERLRKGLQDSLASRGRLMLLVGEPGIGKTRTAEQLASYAARRGCRVFVGHCYEGEGTPAFWPWVQILRDFFDGRDAARIETELGGGASYVAQLVPELRDILPDLPPLPGVEGEQMRFRLFDAVAGFLKRASAHEPLVLLLDDLHWADKPSLLLLQFLARELAGIRVLVVGTYRDVDVQHGHPLAEVLPSLRRERSFERILLRGLPEEEVRSLLATLAGVEAPASFVRALHRETEGNPFFIEETVRHLVEEGTIDAADGRWTSGLGPDEIGLPEGVREVIGRRLARLSEECRRVLSIASALGRDFDATALARVAELDRGVMLGMLEEAVGGRIVEENRRGFHGYRFSHALIRETLYEELGTAERVQLHRRIAEALQALYANEPESHLSELAYHFLEAAPGGDLSAAIEYATGAAELASRQLAHEDAASLYGRALKTLDSMPRPDERQRCELLLACGRAQWRAAEFDATKSTFARAAEVAERHGTAEQFARAALAYSGENIDILWGVTDESQIRVLERALAALGREDSPLRAMVMGRLAVGLLFTERTAEKAGIAAEALAMARRLGDKPALASVLNSTFWVLYGPEQPPEQLVMAEEIIALGEELGDDRRVISGRIARATVRLASEGNDALADEIPVIERMAAQLQEPYLRWYASVHRVLIETANGRWDEVDRLISEGLRAGVRRGGNETAVRVFSAQRWISLWLRGEFKAMSGSMRDFLLTFRKDLAPIYEAANIFMQAEIGERAGARHGLRRIAENGFGAVPRDLFWLPTIGLLGWAAATIGERKSLASLYELLLPYSEQSLTTLFWSVGSAHRVLARMAESLGRFDDAQRHYELALARESRRDPMRVIVLVWFARMMVGRKAGDRGKALAVIREGLELAQALDMPRLVEQALALKLEAEGTAEASTGSSIDLITASIEAKGLDVRRATAPDGTVTLLFSDMEDFSAMTERLGDQRAHAVIRDHNRIVREEVQRHGGYEVELQGDGFLLAFSSARRGVECAVAIQKAFAAYNATSEEPIRVRIGLHTGEVIKEGSGFFGRTVILAARIAARARGGEILVSKLVRELTERDGAATYGPLLDIELKGLAGMHAVCALGWDGHEPPALAAPLEPALASSPSSSGANLFRRSGDVWMIAYEGKTSSLRDAKGLAYIARMLAEPGREFHALDLVGASEKGDGASARDASAGDAVTTGLGSAGEILDGQARVEYKSRLEDLRSELEEAREANDVGRTESLQQEVDFLTRELSAAFGLGGRARKSGDASERARKAVYSRVTESIARIRKDNPALGLHLENAIRLGTFCSYQPEKPAGWAL